VSASDLREQLRSPELLAFVHGGVATLVGTSDANLVPAVTRGFAVRVAPNGESVDVFVGRAQSSAVLDRLRPGGWLAITIASPLDYRAVQIKGDVTRWQAADAADAVWEERYWCLFAAVVAHDGLSPEQASRLRCRDLVRITVAPRALFRQTPGPSAGEALERGAPWG
jgi:hypothetical protein